MSRNTAIPTEKECYDIIKRYEMRENIIRHSEQVMRVSMALVERLKDPSLIRPDLVRAGALLHDIAKSRTIDTKELRHDLIGGEMMRELGYDDIAKIVETHVVFGEVDRNGRLEEREIVFYADKRVMHDKIVSLDERIKDLVDRYGINDRIVNLITENKVLILEIENKIRSFLSEDIEDILARL